MTLTGGTVRLWVVHMFSNVLLLLGVYAWLSIGDANGAQLAGTVIYGFSIAFLALWLYDGTFVYFTAVPRQRLWIAFSRALGTLLPFALVAIVAVVIYALLARAGDKLADVAPTVASWLTLHLRRPVKPAIIAGVFRWILYLVEWVGVPLVLIPVAANVARRGWRGFLHQPLAAVRRRWFALLCPALLLAALFVPWLLMHWVPAAHGLTLETVSAVLRFVAAYLIFLAAWLALARVAATDYTLLPRRDH